MPFAVDIPREAPRLDLIAVVLLTLPPLLWAGNAVVGRVARDSIAPFHLNFLRWLVAAILLFPFVARDLPKSWPALRAVWPWVLLMGLLGVGTYNALQYLALTTSTPINTSLIASSGPIFSLVLGALLFAERVTTSQIAGAAVSLLGVLWVMVHGDIARARAIDLDIGDLYMLLATLSWAVYTWVVRKRRPKVTMAVLLFAQIVSGLMLALPLAAFESIRPAHPLVIDLKTMAMVGYIATCASLIAYFCWDRGVARVGAQLPMFFQNLTPVFAALISSVALHETPELYHLVGLGLILLGIVLASRRAR